LLETRELTSPKPEPDVKYPGIPEIYLTEFRNLRGTDQQLLFVLYWLQSNFSNEHVQEAFRNAGYQGKYSPARVTRHPAVSYLVSRLKRLDPAEFTDLLQMALDAAKTILDPKYPSKDDDRIKAARFVTATVAQIEERDVRQQKLIEKAAAKTKPPEPLTEEKARKFLEAIFDEFPSLRPSSVSNSTS
jgi:hypothetical protein